MKVVVALAALLVIAACIDGIVSRGRDLANDLPDAFPDRITAVSFDTDDNILFIDVVPMDPEVEKRFLCEEIKPKVDASDIRIDASTSYGWELRDCP
jgi:hypothetical protein